MTLLDHPYYEVKEKLQLIFPYKVNLANDDLVESNLGCNITKIMGVIDVLNLSIIQNKKKT